MRSSSYLGGLVDYRATGGWSDGARGIGACGESAGGHTEASCPRRDCKRDCAGGGDDAGRSGIGHGGSACGRSVDGDGGGKAGDTGGGGVGRSVVEARADKDDWEV